MIDWKNLFMNSLWIIGLAIALSGLSYASYQASIQGQNLRLVLAHPSYQVIFNIAGTFFCLGLAGTSRTILEWLVWLALGVSFFVGTGLSIRYSRLNQHKTSTS